MASSKPSMKRAKQAAEADGAATPLQGLAETAKENGTPSVVIARVNEVETSMLGAVANLATAASIDNLKADVSLRKREICESVTEGFTREAERTRFSSLPLATASLTTNVEELKTRFDTFSQDQAARTNTLGTRFDKFSQDHDLMQLTVDQTARVIQDVSEMVDRFIDHYDRTQKILMQKVKGMGGETQEEREIREAEEALQELRSKYSAGSSTAEK